MKQSSCGLFLYITMLYFANILSCFADGDGICTINKVEENVEIVQKVTVTEDNNIVEKNCHNTNTDSIDVKNNYTEESHQTINKIKGNPLPDDPVFNLDTTEHSNPKLSKNEENEKHSKTAKTVSEEEIVFDSAGVEVTINESDCIKENYIEKKEADSSFESVPELSKKIKINNLIDVQCPLSCEYEQASDGVNYAFISFKDFKSCLFIGQNNFSSLPLISLFGQFKQSCWLGSWDDYYKENHNVFYKFIIHKRFAEKEHWVELIRDNTSDNTQEEPLHDLPVDSNIETFSLANEIQNNKNLLETESLPAGVHFSFSAKDNNSLLSMEMTLKPWDVAKQIPENTLKDISSLSFLQFHPHFKKYVIRISCQGDAYDRSLYLEFQPKAHFQEVEGTEDDMSASAFKALDCQFFQGEDIIIPKNGLKILISCHDYEENEDVTIKFKGRFPKGFCWSFFESFINPLTDIYYNGTDDFSINTLQFLLGVYAWYNFYTVLGLQVLVGGMSLAQSYLPTKFVPYMGTTCNSALKKGVASFCRFFGHVDKKVKTSSKRGVYWLFSLLGLNQISTGSAQDYIKMIGVDRPLNKTSFMPLDCLCKNTGNCAINKYNMVSFLNAVTAAEKVNLEQKICSTFCLEPTSSNTRCQAARSVMKNIFEVSSARSDYGCRVKAGGVLSEPSLASTNCLLTYAKSYCSVLKKKGGNAGDFCKFCDSAIKTTWQCHEAVISTQSDNAVAPTASSLFIERLKDESIIVEPSSTKIALSNNGTVTTEALTTYKSSMVTSISDHVEGSSSTTDMLPPSNVNAGPAQVLPSAAGDSVRSISTGSGINPTLVMSAATLVGISISVAVIISGYKMYSCWHRSKLERQKARRPVRPIRSNTNTTRTPTAVRTDTAEDCEMLPVQSEDQEKVERTNFETEEEVPQLSSHVINLATEERNDEDCDHFQDTEIFTDCSEE